MMIKEKYKKNPMLSGLYIYIYIYNWVMSGVNTAIT